MGSPCLNPHDSALAKMMEAIEFSEYNRGTADEVLASYRAEVERDLRRHHKLADMGPPNEREIAVTTEIRAMKDSAFKAAMENERWGWRLAMMYALEHATTADITTHSLLRELIGEVRQLHASQKTGDLV